MKNSLKLPNFCRVEIPIFIEIANIFAEVTVGADTED
jgi:hypothetical protein